MKLYDCPNAPNPRRVHVFLAEKGIEIERVNVDIFKGEHKTPEFLQKNLSGQVPVLELDDGSFLSESLSICRYLEALHPRRVLFGSTPKEIGRIDMHLRRIELQLGRNVGVSWVNGPVVAQFAGDRITQIPEAKKQSDAAVKVYYKQLEGELSSRAMIAGDTYSVADIAAMCIIDFAEQLVDLKPDESYKNLARWRGEVASRPSAKAV